MYIMVLHVQFMGDSYALLGSGALFCFKSVSIRGHVMVHAWVKVFKNENKEIKLEGAKRLN